MPKSVSVRSGQVEFLKLNLEKWEYRDVYQWLLALTWPQFVALIAGVYIILNLFFAAIYALGDNWIAGMTRGSYFEAFFFSVQTLATVGYGHWYPQTLCGHIVTKIEIIVGMFGLAVMTGLIFVRFSRPAARIVFSRSIVIGTLNGRPTLMLRVGNLRAQSMVEAEFRIMFMRDEPIAEGDTFRHFYDLKLTFDRLISFPAALTLRHGGVLRGRWARRAVTRAPARIASRQERAGRPGTRCHPAQCRPALGSFEARDFPQ